MDLEEFVRVMEDRLRFIDKPYDSDLLRAFVRGSWEFIEKNPDPDEWVKRFQNMAFLSTEVQKEKERILAKRNRGK